MEGINYIDVLENYNTFNMFDKGKLLIKRFFNLFLYILIRL